jgi:hypothetical protein
VRSSTRSTTSSSASSSFRRGKPETEANVAA